MKARELIEYLDPDGLYDAGMEHDILDPVVFGFYPNGDGVAINSEVTDGFTHHDLRLMVGIYCKEEQLDAHAYPPNLYWRYHNNVDTLVWNHPDHAAYSVTDQFSVIKGRAAFVDGDATIAFWCKKSDLTKAKVDAAIELIRDCNSEYPPSGKRWFVTTYEKGGSVDGGDYASYFSTSTAGPALHQQWHTMDPVVKQLLKTEPDYVKPRPDISVRQRDNQSESHS